MSSMRLIEAARATFNQLSADQTVLILHPQFRYHNALIDALLGDTTGCVLYITLSDLAMSFNDFWGQLVGEVAVLKGSQPEGIHASPVVAADIFADAVAELLPATVVLVAYDHASHDIHDFVAHTAQRAGNAIRFILSSREWPFELVDLLRDSGRLALLPVMPQDMLLNYLEPENGKVMLEVRALGSGQVLIGGRQITQWDGALPRSLFFYFVDRGMTTRDEVFATFWPELSTREATNVFHVTKRKISEILGVDLTVYSSGFYRISPEIELFYDVVSFGESVQNSAVAEPDEAYELLDRAIALHERDFLTAMDQAWVIKRREELRRTYVDALTAQARIYEDWAKPIEALGLYNRAFGAFPQREDLARAQMRLYRQVNQPQRAMLVYQRLVRELERSLGVVPSPETTALAKQIESQID